MLAIAVDQETSSVGDASLKIKNIDDYMNHADEIAGYAYAAKTPGEWANDLKVAFIDDRGDQPNC